MRRLLLVIPAVAAAQFKPFPSNDQVKVDIDRYIGHPMTELARTSHEVMLTRSILRAGNPHQPGEPAAVLEYRRNWGVSTLLPHNRTPLTALDDQQILFVEGGEGRLDTGTEYWDLRNGIAVLVPPQAKHRLTNLTDKPLVMLHLTWDNPEGVVPRKDILVRDVHVLPFAEKNAHWSYHAKNIFHPSDGLHPNEKVLITYMAPMTIGSPHPHPEHWEEVWTKLGPEGAYLMLGSEVREMPPHTGFISPPNGQTVHSVLNLSKDRTTAWFYFARYTHPAPDYKNEPSVSPKPLKQVEP